MSRLRWLIAGTAVVAILVLGSVVVAATVILPGRDPNTIHEVGGLPQRISVCGRSWRLAAGDPATMAEARATNGGHEPAVVATGPFAPCPPGPCTNTAAGACDLLVWVRVGQDAYVDNVIEGGP
jgi:hypothetical protein